MRRSFQTIEVRETLEKIQDLVLFWVSSQIVQKTGEPS
jgi:hypothetical protein